jgi:hypothetical protein
MSGGIKRERSDEAAPRRPTSAVLEGLARDAPEGEVTLAWVVAYLRERSFGIVMLIVALVGLVPGASTFVGLVLAVPAFQMILGRREPAFPRAITKRHVATRRLRRLLKHVIPALKRLEVIVRPRWAMPFRATSRVVGFVVLLLSASLLAPIPFSHVIPILVIALIAFAFLERDGVLLALALTAAAFSLTITLAAIWGAVEASLLL